MRSQKNIPTILREPIKITFDAMFAQMIIDLTGEDEEVLCSELLSARREFIKQFRERVVAVCSHYEIDYQALGKNFWPVMQALSDHFPKGFRIEEEGRPKKPPKNGGWNVRAKVDLVEFVDCMGEEDITAIEACDWYLFLKNDQMRTAASIRARYIEARDWLDNPDLWTAYDRLEFLRLCYEYEGPD